MLSKVILQGLRNYLRTLDQSTRGRGLIYAKQGKVHLVDDNTAAGLYRAHVQGSDRYETELGHSGPIWWSTCTCPLAVDCKHAAALAHKILELKSRERIPSGNNSGFFKKKIPPNASQTLQKNVAALDEAWDRYKRGQRIVDGRMMKQIFGVWPGVAYEQYNVFPKQELEPTQFWHFLLTFAQQEGIREAPDLGDLNDTRPTLPLINKVKRAGEVQFWNEAMRLAKQSAPQALGKQL
jgi:hypothetical protein